MHHGRRGDGRDDQRGRGGQRQGDRGQGDGPRRQAAAATQHTAAAATPMAAGRSQPGRPVPLAGSSQAAYPAVTSTRGAERKPGPGALAVLPGQHEPDAKQGRDRR